MARILISYYCEGAESTYDSICETLQAEGNDLLRVNINGWVNFKRWAGNSVLRDKQLIEQVKEYNPDLILNFSHSLPIEINKVLAPHVKNCLIDGDNPNLFWNIEYLKENLDKYYYFGMQSASREMYSQILALKDDGRYLYFPPATHLKSAIEKKDKNISFIGSTFLSLSPPKNDQLLTEDFYEVYDKIKLDYTAEPEILSDVAKARIGNHPDYMLLVRYYLTWQERFKYLNCLSDLGLHIYGTTDWKYARFYDAELGRCFDPKPISSLKENQDVYNTSKICINISHPQAKTAFSWRVMDIMASSACLLTEYKPDWEQLFSPYISNEVKNAIVYHNCYDMREKAKRLLDDENLRLRCVYECNAAIEKMGRWKHRFQEVEKFLGLDLIGNDETSQIRILTAKKINKAHPAWLLLRERKNELDIFFYSLLLVLSLLPMLNLVLSTKKIIERIAKRTPK